MVSLRFYRPARILCSDFIVQCATLQFTPDYAGLQQKKSPLKSPKNIIPQCDSGMSIYATLIRQFPYKHCRQQNVNPMELVKKGFGFNKWTPLYVSGANT